MAEAPPKSLQDLDTDTQRLILNRVPCRVDRGRMSLLCRAWRDMVRAQRLMLVGRLLPQPQPPPPLPWLLLPAPYRAGFRGVACVLSACRVHHILRIVPPDARCFGSHGGAWILADSREQPSHGASALNARTGAIRNLPRDLLRRGHPHIYRMVIHAAALSSSPDSENCIGAAIVTAWRHPAPCAGPPPRCRCVAFWRRDWPRALDFMPPGQDDVEDVLCIDGAFVFVTQGEHIRLWVPSLLPANGLSAKWWAFRFSPGGRLYDQIVRARYLVFSGGQILMVVRFTPHPNQPTSKFRVFRVAKRNVNDDNADFPIALYPFAWIELDTLGGRMLFVGHGCSRSYEVDQYPGFTAGIYFLDDGEFYDDAVIFGNGNERRYPCSDNGKWSDEGQIQRCFPRSGPSDHSAPVWLLP